LAGWKLYNLDKDNEKVYFGPKVYSELEVVDEELEE
jgi:hypothetical protein